jgi:hypothetical protein
MDTALKQLRKWLFFVFLVGALVLATFLAIAATQPGDTLLERLNAAYQWLIKNTTGRHYTDLMRENPWLYLVPAIWILTIAGWLLPRKYWGRAILIYIAFGLGFVAGHVFW